MQGQGSCKYLVLLSIPLVLLAFWAKKFFELTTVTSVNTKH